MTLEEEQRGASRIKRCLFGQSDPKYVNNQYKKMIQEHLKVRLWFVARI